MQRDSLYSLVEAGQPKKKNPENRREKWHENSHENSRENSHENLRCRARRRARKTSRKLSSKKFCLILHKIFFEESFREVFRGLQSGCAGPSVQCGRPVLPRRLARRCCRGLHMQAGGLQGVAPFSCLTSAVDLRCWWTARAQAHYRLPRPGHRPQCMEQEHPRKQSLCCHSSFPGPLSEKCPRKCRFAKLRGRTEVDKA